MYNKSKSIGGKIWKQAPSSERLTELVCQRFALPYIVSRILVSRGVAIEDIQNFIEPKIQALMPNPSVLKDMDKSAKKIAESIVNNKKIAVIGDYDVDGATSSSVLRLYLEACGNSPIIHIPERDEGYGPSVKAIDKFLALDANLVVTVDCGTSAFDVLEYATDKGLDVIILDHHDAEVRLPKVFAIVNPKRLDEDNNYPYLKYMAAVGVVFLTMVAVNRELRASGFFKNRAEPDLMSLLDLVALGTVCDVVPLLGLNRAYVKQGLKVMANRKNVGLRSLIDKSGITDAPTAFHLGYIIGPRINACGRVGEAHMGNKLLCSDNEKYALELSDKLNEFNAMRKEIEAYVLLSAIEMLEGIPQEYPIAFVSGNDWHQGVIGIVAGKLKERYNLPSFVLSIEDDEVKGSARSIPSVDLGALIISAKERGVITKGGGHAMAAGFSLHQDKIEEFKAFAGNYVKSKIGDEDVTPVIEIDGTLDVQGANVDLAEKLELLEPYGSGNSEPKLMIKNVRLVKPVIVGAGHIRCILTSNTGASIKAMAFRVGDTDIGNAMLKSKGEVFDVVGVLRRDNWMGRNAVQFMLDDIRFSS